MTMVRNYYAYSHWPNPPPPPPPETHLYYIIFIQFLSHVNHAQTLRRKYNIMYTIERRRYRHETFCENVLN